ncbi:MAG: hypothetical protein K6F86_02505 [Lachnospiraceae bacterium]|nr:hypothetical protein [Lachnospiraceae bacterium]
MRLTDGVTAAETQRLQEALSQKDQEIAGLKKQLAEKTKAYNTLQKTMKKASALLAAAAGDEE